MTTITMTLISVVFALGVVLIGVGLWLVLRQTGSSREPTEVTFKDWIQVSIGAQALLILVGAGLVGFGLYETVSAFSSDTLSASPHSPAPQPVSPSSTVPLPFSPLAPHNPHPAASGATLTPQVTIRFPRNGAHLPNNTFGASGIARNIPTGDQLWLVIKPPSYDRWYPVSRIGIFDNTWTIGPDEICPGGGRQNIEVFLVPNIAQTQLQTYVSHRTAQHDPGIRSLPYPATLKAISRVYVKFNSSVYC